MVHGDPLAGWSPQQIAEGRRWAEIWKRAGVELAAVRRRELRERDQRQALAWLCQPGAPGPDIMRPTSGLVAQQRWFMRARRHP